MRVMIGESLQFSASVGGSSCARTFSGEMAEITKNRRASKGASRVLTDEVTASRGGSRKYSVTAPGFSTGELNQKCQSHTIVIRPAATLRRDPGDDLVRILNVAGLAVNAVRGIQAEALSIRRRRIVE